MSWMMMMKRMKMQKGRRMMQCRSILRGSMVKGKEGEVLRN
jgi:hypothetical protein